MCQSRRVERQTTVSLHPLWVTVTGIRGLLEETMAKPDGACSYLTRPLFPSVSLSLAIETKVDPAFLVDCVKASDAAKYSIQSVSPDSTVASPTVDSTFKSSVMADNKRLRQILAKYPAAITDFFGTGSLCLFKTGDAWPVAEVGAQKLVRAARPVYHDDQRATTWPQTARAIVSKLDSLNISMKLTAVDPLAYANAGQPAIFCDYVIVISVKQKTLEQDDAVAAAPAITAILQVSFVSLRANGITYSSLSARSLGCRVHGGSRSLRRGRLLPPGEVYGL